MIHSVLPNLLLVCSIDMANEGSAALEYNLSFILYACAREVPLKVPLTVPLEVPP